MFGILGSGFGLYGYLPAVAGLGLSPVLLPKRYKSKFLTRQELSRFNKQICWVNSDNALLKKVTTLIVARRPWDQFTEFEKYLAHPQIKKIVLEKPLAPDPDAALEMLKMVKKYGKQCSAGYIFRYTNWANSLNNRLIGYKNPRVEIWQMRWHFMAHHYRNKLSNWKRDSKQGGGVLRFFGIHVISLLAEWGYCDVIFSEITSQSNTEDYSSWQAIFRGIDLPEFRVEIDARSSNNFFSLENHIDEKPFLYLANPFSSLKEAHADGLDPRCVYLQKLLEEKIEPYESWPVRLLDTINLWKIAEERTKIIRMPIVHNVYNFEPNK